MFEESKKNIKRKKQKESEQDEQDLEDKKSKSEQNGSAVRIKLLGSQNEEKEEKNLWNIRAKQLSEMAHSNIVDAEKFELIKRNIENLDGKAASK